MNARAQLFAAYAEWRDWTRRETEAIGAEAWPEVQRCQGVKADLQKQILQFTEAAQADSRERGSNWTDTQREISAVVSQLIEMEHANTARLAMLRSKAEERFGALRQATRNLRRVQGSYGGAAGTQWQSYS
ncbi:MAG: hypothetical protein EBS05_09775 [Proteobacteria bacterium]|nr:hypothetical protein [Pseudomonadota bacterium]